MPVDNPSVEAARSDAPALSVILATDRYATILPVVERLRAQTAAGRLEVVFVTPAGAALRAEMGQLPEFAAVRVVEVSSLDPLAAARVEGVRAATAPLVFIGETHTYPHPGWARALIERAEAGRWGVVVPAFGNANPDGALSWAGFLSDYGGWSEGLPAREVVAVPLYNAAYRRAVLLEFGDRLEHALSHGDEMLVRLRAGGHRAWFEPGARIDHVNVSQPFPWLHERFLSGILIATSRATRWSWGKRLLYACGAPLIPLVLLARIRGGVRATARRRRLPLGTRPALLIGAVVKVFGELVGYLWGAGPAAERRMNEYEVHKLSYVAGRGR